MSEQRYAINKYTGKKIRYIVEDTGDYFVFAPRKTKYGYRMSFTEFIARYKILPEPDGNAEWHKRLATAISKLEQSGLWIDKLEFFKNLNTMSKDELDEISSLYRTPAVAYNKYGSKYPFVFYEDNGIQKIRFEYISESADCILKTMYFGKYENKEIKQNIKSAIQQKTSYDTGRIRVNYDVSFTYSADKNMAWYSEEYKDCGNGHYYIAIDHNTAIFIEND